MSFRFKLSDKRRTTARAIGYIFDELHGAFARRKKEDGLTQQKLADKLEVNRSVVNRRLLGRENMTIRSLAETAWALDHTLHVRLAPKEVAAKGSNHFICADDDVIVKNVAVKPGAPRPLRQQVILESAE